LVVFHSLLYFFSCVFMPTISFKHFISLASRRDTDAIVKYSFRWISLTNIHILLSFIVSLLCQFRGTVL
jgi:hypothetical protein